MELKTKTSRQFSANSERENRLIYLFWEKQWQKAFFDKRPGRILCDAEKGDESAQREIWGFYACRAHTHASRFARGFCRDSGNITSDISHIIKKNPVIGFVSGAPLHFFWLCLKQGSLLHPPCDRVRIGCAFVLLIWLCLKQRSLLQRSLLQRPCNRVRIGFAFALLIWLCLKQGSIDLGAQTAQGMCEVQIVWIICTSSIPAGTALTKAISIYYIDSMLLVNYSLKIC